MEIYRMTPKRTIEELNANVLVETFPKSNYTNRYYADVYKSYNEAKIVCYLGATKPANAMWIKTIIVEIPIY